jgi:hypothetical protein
MKCALSLALVLVLTVNEAFACRCSIEYKKRFKVDSRAASIIVYGQVVETDGIGHWAKVNLIEVYKSEVSLADTLIIGRIDVFTDCSYIFKVGQYALIYSTSSGPVVDVSVCSSTISTYTEKAKKIIAKQRKKLGKMYKGR